MGNRNWDEHAAELVKIGIPALKEMLKTYWDKNASGRARTNIAYTLAEFDPGLVEKPMLKMISRPVNEVDFGVFKATLSSLGKIKSKSAVPRLMEVYANRKNVWGLRYWAAQALAEIKDARAVETLYKTYMLENRNDFYQRLVSSAAMNAIAETGSSSSLEFLITHLESDEASIRANAVKGLINIGEPAQSRLFSLIQTGSGFQRFAAARALSKKMGRNTAKVLAGALDDDFWMVRDEASLALARMKTDELLPLMTPLLKNANTRTRAGAIWVLGENGNEKSIPYLIDALSDGKTGWNAALALGKIGSEKCGDALLSCLKSNDERLKQAALKALAEIKPGGIEEQVEAVLLKSSGETRYWAEKVLKSTR